MDTSALNLTRTWFDEHLREALERSRKTGHREWFAKSLSIPPISLINAFAGYPGFGWFFSTPEGRSQLGLGLSRDWRWQEGAKLERMESQARRLADAGLPPETLVVGGQAFSSGSAWADWPDIYIALPMVQWVQDKGQARLTVILPIQGDLPPEAYHQKLEPIWRALFGEEGTAHPWLGQPARIESVPSRQEWMQLVEQAARDIRQERLDKVVLARQLKLIYPRTVAVPVVLENLVSQNPDATVFALRHQNHVFLGATPEVLATVKAGVVETMCLAGSAPRGLTPEEDFRLADAMMHDAKIVEEHEVVKRHVRNAVQPHTSELAMPDEPGLKKLPSVQHLFTPVRGTLSRESSIWSVVSTLHPTPAVAGYPVASATQYLAHHEPFSRGWYAGTIGWANLSGDGQWMVSLRSGLVHDTRVALYAGCGIMGDSDPESELRESDWKFNTMLSALEIEGGAL